MKSLLIISNFPKKDKAIGSSWYQNLNDKLIRKCVESVLHSLDSRLIYHRSQLQRKTLFKKNSKKHIDIKKKNKEEMEEVYDKIVHSCIKI